MIENAKFQDSGGRGGAIKLFQFLGDDSCLMNVNPYTKHEVSIKEKHELLAVYFL